jgi:hypothetical protein
LYIVIFCFIAFILGPVGGLVGGIGGSIVGYLQSDNYDGAVLAILKIEGERRKVSALNYPYSLRVLALDEIAKKSLKLLWLYAHFVF